LQKKEVQSIYNLHGSALPTKTVSHRVQSAEENITAFTKSYFPLRKVVLQTTLILCLFNCETSFNDCWKCFAIWLEIVVLSLLKTCGLLLQRNAKI